MMTKFFLAFFGLMTAGAVYMTVYDVGVMEPSITQPSIRQGSVHGGTGRLRSYRGGK